MEPVRVIQGRAVPLDRSDVDTDQIIPASWLKRVERTGFGAGLFATWRERELDFVLNREQYAGAVVLIAGPNFGVGSSREHAVWALTDYGFRAVVAPRFGDIFRNNSTKNGLVPVVVSAELGTRLLRESSPGSYAARNAGLRAAHGKVLAFTDFDCVPDRNWLLAGTRALPESGLVALASRSNQGKA